MHVKLNGEFVTQYSGPADFVVSPKKSTPRDVSSATRIFESLRAAGFHVQLFDNFGEDRSPVAEAVKAPEEPNTISWRGITPVRMQNGRYSHRFAADNGVQFSVEGATAQEIFDKILWLGTPQPNPLGPEHPALAPMNNRYYEYLMSLPPEAPAYVPPAPATPAEIGPQKVLRPGNLRQTVGALPPRQLGQGRAQAVSESYASWYRTASAKDYQLRCQQDPAFLQWANAQQ